MPFTTGPLHQLLTNRIYLGEINHRNRSWPGEHQPIVERELFDAVQDRLAANRNSHHERLNPSEALLAGRIFDDRGSRMTPSHAKKGLARYRYYVSLAVSKGRKEDAGSVRRVAAPDVEQLVLQGLRNCVTGRIRLAQLSSSPAAPDQDEALWSKVARIDDRAIVAAMLNQAVIRCDAIELQLNQRPRDGEVGSNELTLKPSPALDRGEPPATLPADIIRIPWTPPEARRRRTIMLPENKQQQVVGRPMRAGVRDNILQAIARGRSWLDDILSGCVTDLAALASQAQVTERLVRSALNMAFLSPTIARAIIEGTLPRGIGLSRLADLPVDWDAQHLALGIEPLSSPTAKAA